MTAADIYGPWVAPDWDSGLIERVRRWWSIPITDLPDAALALFLRQRLAVKPVLAEARRRLTEGVPDGSELYDGELEAAVSDAARYAEKGLKQ